MGGLLEVSHVRLRAKGTLLWAGRLAMGPCRVQGLGLLLSPEKGTGLVSPDPVVGDPARAW